MKKLTFLVVLFMLAHTTFAGGILTNANQSAQYVRMLSRNASTQLDAVYFNPAGIMEIENGLHLGIHNQSIFQTRTITSGFPYLMNKEYEGKISAPAFPDFYAAWKKDKFALSFMVGPVGGGGGAKYEKGLPSFERPVSAIPASLTASGIPTTKYSSNISFEGTSVFWGLQLNGSFKISEAVSVAAGVRVNMATNTYLGHLKDIKINPNQPAFGAAYNGSSMESANRFFTDAATTLNGWSTGANSFATGLQPIVSGGGGTVLLANGTAVGLSATQVAQIQGLLGAAGLTPAQIGGINIQTARATLAAASPTFAGKAALMTANAAGTADKIVDTKQTGTGYTPILGINISPNDIVNIGIKYEHKTKLSLENNRNPNDNYDLFGKSVRSDIPGLIMVGMNIKPIPKLLASISYNQYFDKGVNWGNNLYGQERIIDKNSREVAIGYQYSLTDNFALSFGGLSSKSGVSQQYQSDFSYSNSSYTGGFGFQWKFSKAITLDAGMLYTSYYDKTKSFSGFSETYDKENVGFAIGLTYSIF